MSFKVSGTFTLNGEVTHTYSFPSSDQNQGENDSKVSAMDKMVTAVAEAKVEVRRLDTR